MSLADGQMKFSDVFSEYYTMFSGQGVNLPTFTNNNREYLTAIYLANNGVKRWIMADGILWREMTNTLQGYEGSDSPPTSISDGTTSYAVSKDMRKPPDKVRLLDSNGGSTDIPVIEPHELYDMASNSSYAYFTGGANMGFTMVIPTALATQQGGKDIDYFYHRKGKYFSVDQDPASMVIEMSDPNFLIQHMLMLRNHNARNDFGYNTAKREAQEILMNMKIENTSGNYHRTHNIRKGMGPGFGKPAVSGKKDIIL